MTEIFGYIPTTLNLVAFYLWSVSRKNMPLFNETIGEIEYEYEQNLKELGTLISSQTVELNQLTNVLNGIKRIHFSSVSDLLCIYRLKKRNKRAIPLAFVGLAIAISSLLFGHTQEASNLIFNSYYLLIIIFPFTIFLFELFLLWWITQAEDILENIKSNYRYRRY